MNGKKTCFDPDVFGCGYITDIAVAGPQALYQDGDYVILGRKVSEPGFGASC
jgi:hypothetical protein